MPNEVFIVARARTPIGALGGALATVPAPQLGAVCIEAVVQRAGVPSNRIDEVIMGNVVSAGLGQNPARQAALKAGLPASVGATTVNKVCGSGLKAVMLGAQAIQLGEAQIVVAGGMESMSLAPYLLPHARAGYRLGNGVLIDSMLHDGLRDAYGDKLMGIYGDQCAAKFNFTRQEQDDFAVRSYRRAQQAMADGVFDDEIVPLPVTMKKGTTIVSVDEEPARLDEAKLRALRPAFSPEGTITAANASSMNDGAAALLLASAAACSSLGLKRQVRIVGSATFSHEPEWFTTAPIGAIQKLLAQMKWTVADVDLFEINEAFAAVVMAAAKELNIPGDKLNIYGGSVALGHPIGASGARILVTLLTALHRTGGKRGLAALCLGGGEAVALAVEAL
ncbi:MAG TPA: thiolase family protein [Pirellulales bacterium]|nr:thiolase family protein [Pirellulales bacterium]